MKSIQARAQTLGLEPHEVNLLGRYEDFLRTLRDDQSFTDWRRGVPSEVQVPFELDNTIAKVISLEEAANRPSQNRAGTTVAANNPARIVSNVPPRGPQPNSNSRPEATQPRLVNSGLGGVSILSSGLDESSSILDNGPDELEEKQRRVQELRQKIAGQPAQEPVGNFQKKKPSLLTPHTVGVVQPPAPSPVQAPAQRAQAPVHTQPVSTRPPVVAAVATQPQHWQQQAPANHQAWNIQQPAMPVYQPGYGQAPVPQYTAPAQGNPYASPGYPVYSDPQAQRHIPIHNPVPVQPNLQRHASSNPFADPEPQPKPSNANPFED